MFMQEMKIQSQHLNGGTDRHGQRVYVVELEGNVLLSLEESFLLNNSDSFITGSDNKRYEMHIQNHKVTKVLQQNSIY